MLSLLSWSCLLVILQLSILYLSGPGIVLEVSSCCFRVVLELSKSCPSCPRIVQQLSYLSHSFLSVILQILDLPGSCFRVNKELSFRYPRVVPKLS